MEPFKDQIIASIRARIITEFTKYGNKPEMDWAEIAARKIYSTHWPNLNDAKTR